MCILSLFLHPWKKANDKQQQQKFKGTAIE